MASLEQSHKESFFRIYDPEINVAEIMDSIESRLSERNVSKEDVERVSKIRFSPYAGEGYRSFDPSYTANLFEKGISIPKFTNPKLWFLKGPLKYLLHKFVSLYSLMDKKLSENRLRAFFQVLHEMVLIRKKQEILSQKLSEFYREYAETKYLVGQGKSQISLYSPIANRFRFESGAPPESEELLELVQDAQPVVIYYPESLGFLEFCNFQNLKYKVFTPFDEDADLIRRTTTEFVSTTERIAPYQSVLFHANACLFTAGFWEGLLLGWSRLEQDTRFVIRFRQGSSAVLSPFQDNLPLHIETQFLGNYLKSLGFRNIHIHETNAWGWTNISFHHHPE